MNIQFVYFGKRGGGVNDLISLLHTIDEFNLNIFSLNNVHIQNRTKFLEDKITFDHVDLPSSKFNFVLYVLTFRWFKIIEILKKNRPRVIIITMFHPLNLFIFLYKVIYGREVKIFYFLHNDNKIQTFSFWIDRVIRIMDIFYCLLSNRIFVLSPNVFKYSSNHFLLRFKQITEIGFGVYFNPNPIKNDFKFYEDSPITFVFFGKILPYKGIDNLVRAISLLYESGIDFKCYILGEGKFDYQNLVNFDNVIILNRWLSDDELNYYLKKCHFSIFPYSHCSQSGALSTALSNNLPVLVSNIPILKQQVEKDKIGFILDDIEPQTISRKIFEINKQRKILFNMHNILINKNEDNSDWNNVWDKIKCLFN